MHRAILVALLAAFVSAGPAAAATRDVPFTPVAAPAAGTCPVGDGTAYRVELLATAAQRSAAAPCLGPAASTGPLLLVAGPDETQAGTVLEVVGVTVHGRGASRHLRVRVRARHVPADALALQILSTPRAVVRLARRALPRHVVVVGEGGTVIARTGR